MKAKKDTYRKSEFISVGEGINDLLNAYSIENKYLQTLLITKWDKFMGPSVATRTEKIYFKDKTMHVVLKSAALKHQLTLSKSKIVELVNKEMDRDLIEEIIFL